MTEKPQFSERLELRLPPQVRAFLDHEVGRTGRKYAELIRQYVTDRREWAEWNRSIAAQQRAVDRAAAAAAKPKRESYYDRVQREKAIKQLVLYRGADGYKRNGLTTGVTQTWADYLYEMRDEVNYAALNADPYRFDTELDAVLERRAAYYAEMGVEPPPLAPYLTKYKQPRCHHGTPLGDLCYDCDVENGEWPPKPE